MTDLKLKLSFCYVQSGNLKTIAVHYVNIELLVHETEGKI